MVLTDIGFLTRKMTDEVMRLASGGKASNGNLKKSLLVVVVVSIQLLVSVSVARAVIFFLLLSSGDVEQNPGPDCKLLSEPASFTVHSK